MAKKLRVAVLMGGPSAEHAVSLNTGKMVLAKLDPEKYSAKSIIISQKGRWPIAFSELKNNFDLVFNAMHGEYGEDGTIQKILEKLKMPYTGSNSQVSKLGWNKIACHQLLQKNGLRSPQFTASQNIKNIKKLGLPLVVKPIDRGSSVGITIIQNWKQLPSAIKTAKRYSSKIIFQQYIKGREFTCGVLQSERKLLPLMPTEIIPLTSPFFDYQAKYTVGASQEITPPRLPEKQIKQIQNIALQAHKLIGSKGYSRTDIILGEDNKFYFLEINTLPGMTETSLLPQGAQAIGINFPQLLDMIIDNGLKQT